MCQCANMTIAMQHAFHCVANWHIGTLTHYLITAYLFYPLYRP